MRSLGFLSPSQLSSAGPRHTTEDPETRHSPASISASLWPQYPTAPQTAMTTTLWFSLLPLSKLLPEKSLRRRKGQEHEGSLPGEGQGLTGACPRPHTVNGRSASKSGLSDKVRQSG